VTKRFTTALLFVVFSCACVWADSELISAQTKVWLDQDYQNDNGLSVARDNTQIRAEVEYTNGTGSSTTVADIEWITQRELGSGATDIFDLAGGVSDPFGNALTFARVKSLHIRNLSTSESLTIGNATAPVSFLSPATATYALERGAFVVWESPYAGFTVTAGTGDLLKITNSSGASTTYNIRVVGSSQ